jgi:uncharacterized membrane protein YphA (DoxX/SURF4 family)
VRGLPKWPAFLRVVVGCVWLFEAYPQLASRDTFLGHAFVSMVQSMAAGNPWRLYRDFLLSVVVPHASVFSYLTLVGNALTGICLFLGLLTPYSAAVAIILNINYALASGWMNRADYALNGLLLAAEIVIMAEGGGRVAGVDALVAGRSAKRPRRF